MGDRRSYCSDFFSDFSPRENEITSFCKTTYLILCGSRKMRGCGWNRNTAASRAMKDSNKVSKRVSAVGAGWYVVKRFVSNQNRVAHEKLES
jgi:hypothetical protein